MFHTMYCVSYNTDCIRYNIPSLDLTRGKPQAPSSSFLAFLILSRSSYIII